MNYILASFGSRNETMAFARLLRSSGLNSNIINTPSALAGQGCSISVQLPGNALALAQRVMSGAKFQSFHGFYLIYYANGRQTIEKL